MNTVFLCGERGGPELADTLFDAVRASGSAALHVTDRLIAAVPPESADPDYLVFDHFPAEYVRLGGGIAVFRENAAKAPDFLRIPNDFCAVLDSGAAGVLDTVRGNCRQTVLCGLSEKDTITFSSLGADSAVISLQQTVVTLRGNVIEPREIPVRFGIPRGKYPLLAAAAVLLLTDRLPDEKYPLALK